MGEWLVWLVLGALILVVFCIYSLSSQLERCVQLAVEIITGNQRKILTQLEALAASRPAAILPDNVVPFERRTNQRRRQSSTGGIAGSDERRRSPGRRRDDLAMQHQCQ
jgi:hypothetical protein